MRNLLTNIKTAVAYSKANPNCSLKDKLAQHEVTLNETTSLLKRAASAQELEDWYNEHGYLSPTDVLEARKALNLI